MTALRPSLLPEVLKVMMHNQNHGQDVLHFYEFGHIFHRTDRDNVLVAGYAEHESLILAASGPSGLSGWNHAPHAVDFFDVKGAVETLLDALRIPDVAMMPVYEATPVTACHLALSSGETLLGIVARVSDQMAEAFDFKAPVFFAELDWSTLVALATPHVERAYSAISRYPVVDRDIAVIVSREEAAGPMMATIGEAGAPLLQAVDVFDLYEGEHIGEGKKSLAFALRFGADRTLTDQEVDERIAAVLKQLDQKHNAALRG
jgi:phenylalanyl-tRNA synthetase beta chain